MCSSPSMSKQSDGVVSYLKSEVIMSSAFQSMRKLCVLGGIHYIFTGSASYIMFTDWK